MSNLDELQTIKRQLMSEGMTNDEAVNHIAKLISRSRLTIYEYLSKGRQDIPDNSLELLKFKL